MNWITTLQIHPDHVGHASPELGHALRQAPERREPALSVAETDGALLIDAQAWAPAFEGPLLEPVALLGGEGDGPELDEARRDELSRAAIDAVQALAGQRPR